MGKFSKKKIDTTAYRLPAPRKPTHEGIGPSIETHGSTQSKAVTRGERDIAAREGALASLQSMDSAKISEEVPRSKRPAKRKPEATPNEYVEQPTDEGIGPSIKTHGSKQIKAETRSSRDRGAKEGALASLQSMDSANISKEVPLYKRQAKRKQTEAMANECVEHAPALNSARGQQVGKQIESLLTPIALPQPPSQARMTVKKRPKQLSMIDDQCEASDDDESEDDPEMNESDDCLLYTSPSPRD